MSKEWDILHTSTMPVIALRGLTVFPNVLIHFEVSGRPRSGRWRRP